ncbi:hypothetical protein [Pontibacter kalidii]|uniref:hypothetical protein n=1 Tax=Pontibacter kalidii TaxID=2592049 RepID=UPI0022560586|nr:hypothetical protein [Pontibacter kalidii]
MDNKKRAVEEVLGLKMSSVKANKYFMNMYRYLLLTDTQSLMETLDYRRTLKSPNKSVEGYNVFKFMLRLFQNKKPGKLRTLFPA